MTKQRILDEINEIMVLMVGNDPTTYPRMKELKNHLLEDLVESEAKKSGMGNILKSFKYILKNAKKVTSGRLDFDKFFKYGKWHVVTDTCSILSYSGELNFAGTTVDVDCPKLIQEYLDAPLPKKEIDIPDVATLKDVISERKASNKMNKEKISPIYDFESEDIICNIDAEYLLNVINAGITKLYYDGNYTFYGINEDRSIKAIVLGIRRRKEQ